MQRIIIAPDSFKGNLSSMEVCSLIESGIKRVFSKACVVKVPIADGGEGTVEAFLHPTKGKKVSVCVKDPLFRDIEAYYGIINDRKTAVIEMAIASGLPLVEDSKNPLIATTLGTGQLLLDALERGCKRIILGIGGSATIDGGVGLAHALGIRFLDRNGEEISLNAQGLGQLESIDVSNIDRRVNDCEIIVACDVNNPLYGPNGAAYVYGPQKGADKKTIYKIDENLRHYAKIIKRDIGKDVANISGAGAAGGLGAGILAFTNAVLKPGIDILLDSIGFNKLIENADLIITGEGRIDNQTLNGKVVDGIAKRAYIRKIPLIALVGDISDPIDNIYKAGISAVFSINRRAIPFHEAKLTSRQDIELTIENIMRLISCIKKIKL